jgi:hypothetical protein
MSAPTATGERLDAARRIRVIRDLDEVEGIRDVWQAATPGRFDADIDFYLAFATRPSFVRPHVIAVQRGDELEALLVARIEDVQLPARVGYRTLLAPRARSITLVHGGLIGVDDGNARLLLEELLGSLARGEADVVTLPAQPLESALHKLALATVPAHRRQPFARPAVHRRLELPATMADFLASRSKSTRESVKRYGRKVERELGDRLELCVHDDPADIEAIFADTEPVAAKTYQRGLGVALSDAPAQRALIELGLRRGWFRVYVLRLDGRPIAFWPGYAYGDTFFIGTPGFDPDYAQYRIGTYLQMRMIEAFCADRALRFVDYGFGDGEYKRRFGSTSWEEADLVLFAARPRPLAINAARSMVLAAAVLGRAALDRAGQRDRLKRAWRRRLAGTSTPGQGESSTSGHCPRGRARGR